MEYIDLALDYLKDHKLLAAAITFLFILLLIRNFWFLVKLLVVMALGLVAASLILSFVGKAAKEKRELLKEDESSRIEQVRSAEAIHPYHIGFL
ncbi:MAG: hypothetical protein JRH07_18735 [Deltaproteobacteria bacterium]|nr:hypothetical protein [Deltaproteobacteria bacterium]MBW2123859.1 hypothetical protein [Deltaproteobacteria bacterium]